MYFGYCPHDTYIRVNQQHIRQPQSVSKNQEEEHLKKCGGSTFKIFPLLQIHSSEIELHRSYERNSMKLYKTNLNYLA